MEPMANAWSVIFERWRWRCRDATISGQRAIALAALIAFWSMPALAQPLRPA